MANIISVLIAATLIAVLFILTRSLTKFKEDYKAYVSKREAEDKFERASNTPKDNQKILEAKLPELIEINNAEYFYTAGMMGYDQWAIMVYDESSHVVRIYLCTGKQQNYLNYEIDDPNGLVEIFDTHIFENSDGARYFLNCWGFNPCDIFKQHESYLAGEGPMFEPPIPPTTYHPNAHPKGFYTPIPTYIV